MSDEPPGGTGDAPTYTGRVRVTSPMTSAPSHVRRSVRQEIDESTGIGEIYMRALIRSQLRAALTVALTLLLSVGALPLTFMTFDTVTDFEVLGVPAPWLVLGVLVYPGLFALGWVYIRQAERAEREFADLVQTDRAE